MATRSVVGNCRLCGATAVELRDSHIIPKWAYRRVRDSTGTIGAPDPIQIADGVAVQTSTQLKEYMLCGGCELRLCRDEDYVSKLAVRDDGTHGLLESLPAGAVFATGPQVHETPPLRAASISHLDRAAIARFAASIFWRAHASRTHRFNELRLWSAQGEALRRFLLGDRLPPTMCLSLFVPVDGIDLKSVHWPVVSTPGTGRKGDNSAHGFLIAGLFFNLTTGSLSVPQECLECGEAPHAIIAHWRSIPFIVNTAGMALAAEPKGKGARAARRRPKK